MPLCCFVGLGQGNAQAEPAPEIEPLPAPTPELKKEREGFLLGGYFGFGSLDAGGASESTVNYRLEIGGFVMSKLAILVGIWGGSSSEDNLSVSNNNAGLMAQYWLQDSLWLKGDLGTARLSFRSDGMTFAEFNGMAIGGSVGWNFYSTRRYHLSASFGVTFEGYEDLEDNTTATALVFGLQYY